MKPWMAWAPWVAAAAGWTGLALHHLARGETSTAMFAATIASVAWFMAWIWARRRE